MNYIVTILGTSDGSKFERGGDRVEIDAEGANGSAFYGRIARDVLGIAEPDHHTHAIVANATSGLQLAAIEWPNGRSVILTVEKAPVPAASEAVEQLAFALGQNAPSVVGRGAGPYQSIYVHFERPADVEAFARLVGQPVSTETRRMSYPAGLDFSAWKADLEDEDGCDLPEWRDPLQTNLFGDAEWWEEYWGGMPEFVQRDLAPWQSIQVDFARPEDVEAFARLVGQPITPTAKRTRSVWYPEAEIGRFADKRYVNDSGSPKLPRYPIFIPTKGRAESRLTLKALDALGVPYQAVVEEHQVEDYVRAGVERRKMLVQPTHNRGLVVTRNWIWDHALATGTRRFWTMDDNIEGFYRLNRNLKTPVADGTMLRAIEDFADRYENLPIAGMNYFMFASRKTKVPPLTLNTRVYSNMLIETDARDPSGRPYRNEGFYNDDTDLCLRVLKDGRATALFNAFLIFKATTMTVGGGMTPHYLGDGRRKMAEELRAKHPDVTKITWKWGRWQHQVDYSRFRANKLVRAPGIEPRDGVDDLGMRLHVDAPSIAAPQAATAVYEEELSPIGKTSAERIAYFARLQEASIKGVAP